MAGTGQELHCRQQLVRNSPNDAAPKPDLVHTVICIQRPQHADSTAVNASSQRAQVFAQQGRQHVQAPVLQVHCGPPSICLTIQKAALEKNVVIDYTSELILYE